MTMTGNHAPMKGSRFKGSWDGNVSPELRLRTVIDEHLAAEAPDTFVSPGEVAVDVEETFLDFTADEPDVEADLADERAERAGFADFLPGESSYYRRTELDDDGTIDLEAHEAGWGTVFDPDDLGWGFKVEDGFSIRRRGQSYAKAF